MDRDFKKLIGLHFERKIVYGKSVTRVDNVFIALHVLMLLFRIFWECSNGFSPTVLLIRVLIFFAIMSACFI